MTSTPSPNSRTGQGQTPTSRRKRKLASCDHCRHSKLKCDRQHPCASCKRRGRGPACVFRDTSDAATTTTNQVTVSDTNPPPVPVSPESPTRGFEQSIGVLPGLTSEPPLSDQNQPLDSHWTAVLERPALEQDELVLSPLSIDSNMPLKDILKVLPPRKYCDYLVSHFFVHISALFPVLHGPTFQGQYAAFMQNPGEVDMSWLALLFSISSLALRSIDANDPRLKELVATYSESPEAISRRLQRTAMACLSQDHFFVRHKFSTFEALLVLIYNVSHNESVNQGWALLGMALNIGIALRCHADARDLNPIENERRRRCWVGLLSLHTYHGILFRDFDMSFLLDIKTTMPADVNDSDITPNGIVQTSNKPTQMSVMLAKVRLFRLSSQVCRILDSDSAGLDQTSLGELDHAIVEEQKQWDSIYLINGAPSILDARHYAYWCVLQTYAHHLYLLLHRPFYHSQKPNFLPASRERCIASGLASISIHRKLYEDPWLGNFTWLLNGVTSLKALQAAVTLDACLLDMPSDFDAAPYREELEKFRLRMEALSSRSSICLTGYRILSHLK